MKKVSIRQMKELIKHHITVNEKNNKHGLIIMMEGVPGIGKTELPKQVAKDLGIDFLTINLAAKDAGDIQGLPYIDEVTGMTSFAQPRDLPRDGRGILLFDEGNRVRDNDMKSTLLSLLMDREVNGHKLGEGWIMMLAGNPSDDKNDVVEFDSALSERIRTVRLSPTVAEVVEYLSSKYSNHFLLDFVKANPDIISFNYEGVSPRTLEKAIQVTESLDKDDEFTMLNLEIYLGDETTLMVKKYLEGLKTITVEDVLNGKELNIQKYDISTINHLNEKIVDFLISSSKISKKHEKSVNNWLLNIQAESCQGFVTLLQERDLEESKLEEIFGSAIIFKGLEKMITESFK